jgi:hypothetical protein
MSCRSSSLLTPRNVNVCLWLNAVTVAYLPISAQGGPSEQTAAFLKSRS